MSTTTVGLIGCGGHVVQSHLPFMQNARVIGIYDKNPIDASASRVLGYNPPSFASISALINAKPDRIIIGSPDKFHPEQLQAVVGAGIPVLCEKPLAIDAKGQDIVRKALRRAHNKRIAIASCHQRRSDIVDLPYGWVRSSLAMLEQTFGTLQRVGLNSNYPTPRAAWKHDRSFLADKFVHDIDYLRILLGQGPLQARRAFDSHDHYVVRGSIGRDRTGAVTFHCEGTRLHNDANAFIEYIMLNFEYGDCVVYTKPGIVRLHDRRSGKTREQRITPMNSTSYDRLNAEVTNAFLVGRTIHTPSDLMINTAVVVSLAGPEGRFGYE